MENTTIAITKELKEQLSSFGRKGESYAEILAKLIRSAKERQLQELLMDEEDTVTIDEALKNAKEKWQE